MELNSVIKKNPDSHSICSFILNSPLYFQQSIAYKKIKQISYPTPKPLNYPFRKRDLPMQKHLYQSHLLYGFEQAALLPNHLHSALQIDLCS